MLAVALAVETGVPAGAWLDDPRAMFTAVRYLELRAERMGERS
jgi:hypothetical protein